MLLCRGVLGVVVTSSNDAVHMFLCAVATVVGSLPELAEVSTGIRRCLEGNQRHQRARFSAEKSRRQT